MRMPVLMCLALLLVGCSNESDLASLRERVTSLEKQVAEQREQSESSLAALRRENDALRQQNEELLACLSEATNSLAFTTEKLAQATRTLDAIKERERARRDKLAKSREDEQRRRQEALEQVRNTNQPSEYPFRVFDTMFIGQQYRDGTTREYGRFSIRNYTEQQLTGKAYSTSPYECVSIDVPPNPDIA